MIKKIVKFFKAIQLITLQPSLLNKVLDDEDVNKRVAVNKLKIPVAGHPLVDITELIPSFDVQIDSFAFLEGGSMTIEIALLKALAAQYVDCNYLEIGTWRGESVANIAPFAKHCVTINLSDEAMRRLGKSEKYIQLHGFFSNKFENIMHIKSDSRKFDFGSLNKKFDLVYIDGDHHYESVMSDTRNAFQILKDENSVIVWHDYGDSIDNIRWDIVRAIVEGTPESKRKNIYRISNTRSAIYTSKNVKSGYTEYPQTPTKHFKVRITVVNQKV